MNKFLLALFCSIGLIVPTAFGQMTQITASNLKIGSSTISTGTVCAVAVDATEQPITVAVSGGGLEGPGSSCGVITAGVITGAVGGGTYSLPDTALAGNPGFGYTFTVTDTSVGQFTSNKSFQLHKVPNVTGATFALDHYFPTTTVTTAPVFTFTTGSGAPSGACAGKSFYQDNSTPSNPILYSCGSDLTFHVVTGGSVTYGTTAGTAAQGNDSRFTANAAAAAAAQTTANTAVANAAAAQTTANAAATPATVASSIKTAVPQSALPDGVSVDAEWTFNDGSGTIIRDISGNGHDATFGGGSNAPSWNSYGVAFNSGASLSGTPQFATTNITSWKSVIIAHCINPGIQTTGIGGTASYATYPAIFGSSTSDGFGLLGVIPSGAGNGKGSGAFQAATSRILGGSGSVISATADGYGQCQTTALTLGASDVYYVNGKPAAIQIAGSSASIVASSGGYEFGADYFGGMSSYSGTITYALLSTSSVWTPAQVQLLNSYIQHKLAARTMPVYPTFNQVVANQVIFAGDSLWAGRQGSAVWTTKLTLNNSYTISNWGISGINAFDLSRLAESRWYSQVAPSASRNIIIFDGGSNDVANGYSAATIWSSIALEAKKAISVGAIPVVSTIISRNGQDSNIAPVNALIRAGWKQAGFVALLDNAEVPAFAAGASSNATYYYSDGTHLTGLTTCDTTTGYGWFCVNASRVVNTLDGSSVVNPDTTTSNAFVATDANNFVVQTPTAAATYQLVPCQAITGQTKTIVNGSASFAITVSATAPDTIVGSISVPAGGSMTYTAEVSNPMAGGCYWLAK